MLYSIGMKFRLKRFALWLLDKELDLVAMCTHKALANRLLALSNRFYKPSVLTLALRNKKHYFSQNKFYYRISVLEQPVETRFQAILTVGISFHKLVFTVQAVKTSCTPLRVHFWLFIRNTANGWNHYNAHSSTILHYFDSIFY